MSQTFPPFNTSGAVRVGKFAKYLIARGHDVRVLTASPLPYPQTLALEIPPGLIVHTRSLDPMAVLAPFRRHSSDARNVTSASRRVSAARTRLRRWVAAVVGIPEPQAGWYPYAVSAGRRLLQTWRPDVIYASALPFTAHMVASRLARHSGIPWIAEFRDHFYGNPYSNLPAWRGPLDRVIERRAVSSAAACVTVSEPMAETLRARYGKPTAVVLNGCDVRADNVNATERGARSPLRILYTGVIYPGRRDPSALFAAVASLGELAADVELIFYGQDLRGVAELAMQFGVSDRVHLRAPIPHSESLSEQQRADVLLLLLWSDPREAGVYTGKLFEYVGARRQILAIGAHDGVAAHLIRSRQLGVVACDPDAIAATLRGWIDKKRRSGEVPAPPMTAICGLTRDEQFKIADDLLRTVQTAQAVTASR